MQFRDNVPGFMDSRGAEFDSTRNDGMVEDANLGDWFSRPISIASYDWEVDNPIFQRLNPWKEFWENPRNLEKVKNFHLLRCKLHVKILINGNAFYYGRAIAAYEPLVAFDRTSPTRDWVPSDRVRGSQRMHVYLNPTTSQGGTLELPFFWPSNNLIIPSKEWRDMGELVISSFTILQHANAGTDKININVMAWAEDVKLSIPTREFPVPEYGTEPESGSDEHDKNIISRPASNVARFAGSLSNVPTIGPYAKATEIGATALASIAKMFGLSAPNNLNYELYEPRAKHSLAVTDTKQSAHKVTIDSKQELTIDPRTTGIQPDDELPIASIAGRESYIDQFNWIETDDPGDHLWNCRVDPGLKERNGEEWHFPACALAAMPFQYWRGTMRFRFQIVASEYHKGRIRIVYDPSKGGSTSEFNTHYSTVHDIAECKDFTVDVGWGQNVAFKESIGWNSSAEFGTTPLVTSPAYGNGVISVYVLNRLSVPSTASAPIQINVFVSMLEDFEVAAPDDKISHLKFRPNVDPPTQPESGVDEDIIFHPESGIEGDQDQDAQQTPVEDPVAIDRMADTELDVPNTTKVFMGETIASFRALLKRAYRSEIIPVTELTSASVVSYSRSAFPTYGGFIEFDEGTVLPSGSMISTFGDTRTYNTAMTTLLNYLGRAFIGWRGSIRWTVDLGQVSLSGRTINGNNDFWNSITYTLSRTNRYTLAQLTQATGSVGSDDVIQLLNEVERGNDCLGEVLCNTAVNPIQTIEVPYMSNQRFSLTADDDNFVTEAKGPGWKFTTYMPGGAISGGGNYARIYCSAGEDFNFFYFNGLPPVYYEAVFATDTST
jgi:hypothetical protein